MVRYIYLDNVDQSADLNATLIGGFIIENGEMVTPPTLISFNILNPNSNEYETYQAEENMTWEQWIVSKYNTSGYIGYNTSNFIGIIDDDEIVQKERKCDLVIESEQIIDNYNYTFNNTGHCSGADF